MLNGCYGGFTVQMSSLWTPHSGSNLAYVLVYVLAAAFVVIILEMNIKTNILVSLLRPYFFILHGTWIFQVGVILYYPVSTPWDQENYHNLMKTSILFTCHCGVIVTVMVATYCLFPGYINKKTQLIAGTRN
jgi:hypothetical protein